MAELATIARPYAEALFKACAQSADLKGTVACGRIGGDCRRSAIAPAGRQP